MLDLEKRIELAQKFLEDFDAPIFRLLEEGPEVKEKITNFLKNRTLEENLALNKDYSYGLFFSPNGCFQRANILGENVKFSKAQVTQDSWICAFVVDVDLKCFEKEKLTMESLLPYIRENLKELTIQPTYIVRSGWGYHLYWVIKREDRKAVFKQYGERLFEISKKINEMVHWDPNAIVSQSLSALIRLPYSIHKKTLEEIMVEVIEHNPQNILTEEIITKSMRFFEQKEELEREIKTMQSKDYTNKLYEEAGKIPMPELLAKLKEYPRLVDGHMQTIHITGNDVYLMRDGARIEKFHSWKYNKADNYIICFAEQDLYHAPQGNWYGFLYWYFNKNSHSIYEFLQKEFNITINLWMKSLWRILNIFEDYRITVVLYEKGATITEEMETKGGKPATRTKIMFKKQIKVLWKGEVCWAAMWEAATTMAYVLNVDWEEMVVIPKASKREHNKLYTTQLFCYGDDNDLWAFFECLNKSEKVLLINIYENSGYYNNLVNLWGTVMLGELGTDIIQQRISFKTIKWEDYEQVSVKEYFKLFRQVYTDEVAVPAVLQALALAWMNLRANFNTYPALLISGKTGSGKSAMARLLKIMLGYAPNARVMSLPWITPQPLKQAASDYSVLFLEELTQKVWEATEELLRNIVNRDLASRGLLEGNVDFPLRSPLFVVGERTFKDESLNNRFCSIISSRKHWREHGKEKLVHLEKVTAYEEIYSKFNEYSDWISEMAKDYSLELVKKWFDSRNADTYAFMFVSNNIFELWIDEEELFNICKKMLQKVGLVDSPEEDHRTALKSLITRICVSRQAGILVKDVKVNWQPHLQYSVTFYSEDIYQKYRGLLNTSIMEINEELWERVWRANATAMTFTVKLMREAGKPVDPSYKKIDNFFEEVIDLLPRGADCIKDVSGL